MTREEKAAKGRERIKELAKLPLPAPAPAKPRDSKRETWQPSKEWKAVAAKVKNEAEQLATLERQGLDHAKKMGELLAPISIKIGGTSNWKIFCRDWCGGMTTQRLEESGEDQVERAAVECGLQLASCLMLLQSLGIVVPKPEAEAVAGHVASRQDDPKRKAG
jgi:hypothetical protein